MMRLILTGATGFLGSEVLNQCCQSDEVDSVIVLSRRPLQQAQLHAKVQSVIVKDFTSYSAEVTNAIADANACIWCLGGRDAAAEVDFPTTFTRAISEQSRPRAKDFTYVHCSGILAERDQTKPLWFMQEGRRAKGQAETFLLNLTEQPASTSWKTYIMRPSVISPKDAGVLQRLLNLLLGSVRVDELATAAIRLALHGNESATLENNDLVQLGRM